MDLTISVTRQSRGGTRRDGARRRRTAALIIFSVRKLTSALGERLADFRGSLRGVDGAEIKLASRRSLFFCVQHSFLVITSQSGRCSEFHSGRSGLLPLISLFASSALKKKEKNMKNLSELSECSGN
jgi:hypothetical protein